MTRTPVGVEAVRREQLEQGKAMGEHPERVHHLPQTRDRIGARRSRGDLPDHVIDDRVEQMRLAREIVVNAHRLATEESAEAAKAEIGESVAIDQCKSGSNNPLAIQWHAHR
jgi:hypothetical protein